MIAQFLKLLQAAPPGIPIIDPEKIKGNYTYWRIRIFYSMFMGYTFFYFTRKSFTFAMPLMLADLGLQKSDLGILATIFALTYGLSKFLSGIVADHSNARYFMAVGLMLTAFCNVAFGLSSSLIFFALFWGLNGWFQGYGWPPCARLLTHWYSQSERGSWWSSWNVSHNVGGVAIALLAWWCASWGWRWLMFAPGIICFFVAFLLINRLRDTPQSLGLPPIEVYRNEIPVNKLDKIKENKLSSRQILVDYVLKNPYIWLLAVAYFFVYFVRMGMNDWTVLYMVEEKGYSPAIASFCLGFFDIGGFFGSLTAGWASDYLFQARRGPINVLFSIGMLISIFLFWLVPEGSLWLDSFAIFWMGFLIYGPQMMIGVAAAELSHKKAAATSTGFIGWVAYVGAAAAGYPLAKVAQDWGWEGFFWVMVICCAVSIVSLVPLWGAQQKPDLEPSVV